MEVFDDIRAGVQADRAQFFKDLSAPFYGANRPGAKVSQGLKDSFWLQGMMGGLKPEYDCIKAFSETDFTEDLKAIRRAHPDPARRRRPDRADRRLRPASPWKLVKGAKLKVYPGAPHGMCSTHKDEVNRDLLEFIRS